MWRPMNPVMVVPFADCHFSIAARVAGLAGSGELLASRTVRDLAAGSGYTFSSRGTYTLKGVPDEWELLAVT